MIALRLSKSGYGRPDQILNMRTDIVVTMLAYETFLPKYEDAAYELNRKEE